MVKRDIYTVSMRVELFFGVVGGCGWWVSIGRPLAFPAALRVSNAQFGPRKAPRIQMGKNGHRPNGNEERKKEIEQRAFT